MRLVFPQLAGVLLVPCFRFLVLLTVLAVFAFNPSNVTSAQEEQAVTATEGNPAEPAEQNQEAEEADSGGKREPKSQEAPAKPQGKKKPAPPKPSALNGINYINDVQITQYAEPQMNRMIKAKEALTCTALESQIENRKCQVNLVKPGTEVSTSVSLYREASKSVVAILISRKHLDHWHLVLAATGFFISDDGVIATNRHVFNKSDEYMFVMTSDYKVHPIKEVLGANLANDLAYFRIETDAYRGLALRTDIPVGASVSLISHPSGHYYSYSRGIVTRRYIRPPQRPSKNPEGKPPGKPLVKVPTKWITLSAEFGKGSSGGPVFDRFGNVVGMATSTNSLRVGEKTDKVSQMVFRDCVPAAVMLDCLNR